METCAGCHSLSGVKLNGPDLSPVATWPLDQLKSAIKRMEKNVGTLTDGDVEALASLLHSPDVRERLKAQEARIQAAFAVKLDPPDAVLGSQLFFGRTPLQNGGLPCAACHTASGQGGNLGPDLTAVYFKMGETPLVSAIEKAAFKVMEPHYRWRPVTRQEAVHLSKFLSTLDPKTVHAAAASFVPLGAGGALAALAGLIFYFRAQRHGRDTRLQRRRK